MSDDVLAQGPLEPESPAHSTGPAHVALGVASLASGVGALLGAVLVDWGRDIFLVWPILVALVVAQLVLAWRAWRRAEYGTGRARWGVLALAAGGLLLNVVAFFWASFHAYGC